MKFRIQKWNQLTKVKKAIRVMDMLAIVYMLVLFSFTVRAEVTATSNSERLFIINSPVLFKVLNPFSGEALATALPFMNIGFLNATKIDEVNESIENIKNHEVKHLEQYQILGPIKVFQLADWKVEGIAEYARGKSTVDICATAPLGTKEQLEYRKYHIVAKYLIESEELTETEIYGLDTYPLEIAEKWVREQHCEFIKGL